MFDDNDIKAIPKWNDIKTIALAIMWLHKNIPKSHNSSDWMD